DREERNWHAGDRGLVGEDQLIGDGRAAAAELCWPAQREPAVGAELAYHLAVGGPVPVVAAGPGEAGPPLRRHQRGEILAQLIAPLVLLRRVAQVHAASQVERVLV